MPPQESDYTHYAFTVAEEDFEPFSQRLSRRASPSGSRTKSEGVVLFLDPDGHKLELHVGSLAARGGVPRPTRGDGVYPRRA